MLYSSIIFQILYIFTLLVLQVVFHHHSCLLHHLLWLELLLWAIVLNNLLDQSISFLLILSWLYVVKILQSSNTKLGSDHYFNLLHNLFLVSINLSLILIWFDHGGWASLLRLFPILSWLFFYLLVLFLSYTHYILRIHSYYEEVCAKIHLWINLLVKDIKRAQKFLDISIVSSHLVVFLAFSTALMK